jgi:seryl-tRNA synthetase
MHDIRSIRENPEAFDAGLARRGLPAISAELLALDTSARTLALTRQNAEARRNELSRQIGAAMKAGDSETAQRLKAEVESLRAALDDGRASEDEVAAALRARLEVLPNLPDETVPDGADETANVEVRRWGEPRTLGFQARSHFEIGAGLGLMDFEGAAAVAGARFVVLRGALARLERALAAFMVDLHTAEFGYVEIAPPLLVRSEAVYGVGQLPKFEDDLFRTTDGRWLISTAEVSLTNLVRERILREADLPMRLTADTPCFRSEAGAAGRDTRGMMRMHQFRKVELVSVVAPEESAAEHERMTACAEEVLRRLELPFRTMLLCAGDMGAAARRTYDLEVWLPSEGRYREISSCSSCGDYQARRMNARYRTADGRNLPVHTLNGSGLAVGRTMVALLENHQQADASVVIPPALRPWMGGMERIG